MSHGSKIPQVPRSNTNQGYFGRMFPNLIPPKFEEEQLKQLALAMYKEDREDSDMPAGYTYFGQFVSHDITFDPTSRLDRINDPEMLNNFRTPRFDLDSIYGRGPEDHPFLYRDVDEEAFGFQIKLENKENSISGCKAELLEKAKRAVLNAGIVTGINEFIINAQGIKELKKIIPLSSENHDIASREIHFTITGSPPLGFSIDDFIMDKSDRDEDMRGMLLLEEELKELDQKALEMPRSINDTQELAINLLAQNAVETLAGKAVWKVATSFLLHFGLNEQKRQLQLAQPDLSSAKSCEALSYLAAYLAVHVLYPDDSPSPYDNKIDEEWRLLLMNKAIDFVTQKVKTFAIKIARSSMNTGVGEMGKRNSIVEADLPRIKNKAIIGDPRNDVNTLISQLHLCFLMFHNQVIKRLALLQVSGEFEGDLFAEARRVVTWHYQWVVVHDFLRRLVGKEALYFFISPPPEKGDVYDAPPIIRHKYYQWSNNTYIPVEFSAAAYRFGHSIIRSSYKLNDQLKNDFPVYFKPPLYFEVFEAEEERKKARGVRKSKEDDLKGGLKGNRKLPLMWTIQWDYFLNFEDEGNIDNLQRAKKINNYIAPELGEIPIALDLQMSLTEKNLLRGQKLGLPSGQQVSRAIGIEPIEIDDRILKELANVYTFNKIHQLVKEYKLIETFRIWDRLHRLNDWLEVMGANKHVEVARKLEEFELVSPLSSMIKKLQTRVVVDRIDLDTLKVELASVDSGINIDNEN